MTCKPPPDPLVVCIPPGGATSGFITITPNGGTVTCRSEAKTLTPLSSQPGWPEGEKVPSRSIMGKLSMSLELANSTVSVTSSGWRG